MGRRLSRVVVVAVGAVLSLTGPFAALAQADGVGIGTAFSTEIGSAWTITRLADGGVHIDASEPVTEPESSWQTLKTPGGGGQITSLAVSPFDSNRVLIGGDVLGVGLSDDGGDAWRPTYGFGSWEIADFTFHPSRSNEVWVGTMGGPYVSLDGGYTWSARRVGMPAVSSSSYTAPIQKILFDPANSAHLLAFGGSHREMKSAGTPAWGVVWESRDGGATWTRKSSIDRNIMSVVPLSSTSLSSLLAATNGGGVFASTDGGATWSPSNSGLPTLNVQSLAADPSGTTVFAALGAVDTTAGGIWKSTDKGHTWVASSNGLAQDSSSNSRFTPNYKVVALAPSSPNVVYTADRSWYAHGIYRSTDGGASWTAVLSRSNSPLVPWGTAPSADAFGIDPRNANIVFAGQQEYAVRTENGGATWSDVTSSTTDDHSVGTGFSGLVATDIAISRAHPGRIYLTGMDGGNLVMSTDNGATWTRPLSSYDNWNGATSVALGGTNEDTVYVLLGQRGFNGVAISTDAGDTWSVISGPGAGLPDAALSSPATGSIAASATDGAKVWLTLGGTLYRSTDGGQHWTAGPAGLELSDLAVSDGSKRKVFAAGPAGLYASTDGGATVSLVPGSPAKPNRLRVDPSNAGRLYLTTFRSSGGGLFQYDGATFRSLRADSTLFDVAVDPTNPQRLAAVSGDQPFHDMTNATGVWVSQDSGATWQLASAGLAMTRMSAIAFDPTGSGRAIAGTLGRGFFWASLSAA